MRSRKPFAPATWAILASLFALVWMVYSGVHGFAFANWDDPTYITDNPMVMAGLSWHTAWWALTTTHAPYWHPMTWLSHLIDISLFGMDAGVHHAMSVVIHAINTALVFLLLRRMTGALWRSAFVAAVFAVHPLHVESVAWIAERKDVLSSFFLLLTIWAYVSYVAIRSWPRYLIVPLWFVLALMSKPMVVTLPLVLLLLDVWPLQRAECASAPGWLRLLVEKLPLFALSAASGVATFAVQLRVGAVANLHALPWTLRLANAIVSYVLYIWLTIWPVGLAAFYPQHAWPLATVCLSAAFLIFISLASWMTRCSRPYLLTGWAWYVITVAPVIGLTQSGEQAMADRFVYVPMLGLLVMMSWGSADLTTRVRATWRQPMLAALASVVIVALGFAAQVQTSYWVDSVTLWRHAIAVTPNSYLAFENLGQALRERGELAESIASYERARTLAPTGSPAYVAVIENAIGLVRLRQGLRDDAGTHFEAAARLNPGLAEASINLGNVLASEGRLAEATLRFEDAIRVQPDLVEALVGLGGAELRQGDGVRAAPVFQRALDLSPNLAEAHNGMGSALALEGDAVHAKGEYERAIQLKPDLVTAHYNLAALLIKEGHFVEARQELTSALNYDPDYVPARELLHALDTGKR